MENKTKSVYPEQSRREYLLWAVVWLLLNALDFAATYGLILRGGQEVNPFLSGVSIITLLAFKILAPFGAIGILYLIKRLYWLEGMSLGMAVVVVYTARWLIL